MSIREIREKLVSMINDGSTTFVNMNLSQEVYEELKHDTLIVLNGHNTDLDLLFVYMMVQFTMREYTGADFYQSFCTSMGYQGRVDEQFLSRIIKNTIDRYNLRDFGCLALKGRNQRNGYVECLKAHALSYHGKQVDLFDSSFKIYEWLGFNLQNKENVKRELFLIKKKIQNTVLPNNKDDADLSFGEYEGISQRLSMPISTCRFFSYVDIDELMDVFYPILQLLDNWFYRDDEPNLIIERRVEWIRSSFTTWVERRTQEESAHNDSRVIHPHYRNLSPSYRISPYDQRDSFKIVIPEITNQAAPEKSKWYCKIRSHNNVIQSLELPIASIIEYDDVSFWKTREIILQIDWKYLFEELHVSILQSSNNDFEEIKEWVIGSNTYALFDANGYQIKKLRTNGDNILFTRKGVSVTFHKSENLRKNETVCFDKYVFGASKETIVQIDNRILSFEGQYHPEPFFPNTDNKIEATVNNEKIIVSKTHPILSIVCKRGEECRILVSINDTPRRWLDNSSYRIIPDISNRDRVIITFSIESFFLQNEDLLEGKDGYYEIKYGLANERPKKVSYLLMQSFTYWFSRPRFYDTSCELKISKEYDIVPIQDQFYSCDSEKEKDNSLVQWFNVIASPACSRIRFRIPNFNDAVISIPIRKAIFGFDENDEHALFFRQQPSIPVTIISNALYVTITDAHDMRLRIKEFDFEIAGIVDDNISGRFRFDLTGIVQRIKEGIPSRFVLSYTDSNERETDIRLQSVIPYPPEKCFILNENKPYYLLNALPDGMTEYVNIYDSKKENSPICSLCFNCSGKKELISVECNQTFWFQRYLSRPNPLPFLEDDKYNLDFKKRAYVLYDINNLTGTEMEILDTRFQYQYRYSIRVLQKLKDGIYFGFLDEDGVEKYPICFYGIRLHEKDNCLSGHLACILESDGSIHQLAIRNKRLIQALDLEPNEYHFRFNRNTFRKLES